MLKKKTILILTMLLCVAIAGSVQAGLIAHYNMEESAGPITDQVGGETAEQVDSGHIYSVAGPNGWGKAVGLDANGAWQLDATESAELWNLTNDFSVAAWVYLDSSIAKTGTFNDNDRIIGDDVAWDGDAWSFGIRGGVILFTKNGVIDAMSGVAVPTDRWVHLAAVLSSAVGIEFYLDGVLVNTNDNKSNCNVGDDIFGIGRSYGIGQEQWFPGSIDEVRVYDEVLTDAEIKELASAVIGLVTPTNGEILVDPAVIVEWEVVSTVKIPSSYDVYLDPNQDKVKNATAASTDLEYISVGQTGLTFDPTPDLTPDATYYLRVDSIITNPAETIEGSPWKFTTAPLDPVVTTDPVSQVMVGGEATLTVEGVNQDADGYQWYKSIDKTFDPAGDETKGAAIDSYDATEEGYYYCVISNEAGSDQSAAALVLSPRKVAHWKFDGDLTDDLGVHNGTEFGPAGIPFNTVDQIAGTAAVDPNESQAIEVAHSDELNFVDYTVSAWAKPTATGSHRALISSRSDSPTRTGGYIIYHVNGNWQFWTGNGVGKGWQNISAGGSVKLDEWQLVTVTFESTGIDGDVVSGIKRVYVNGLMEAENDAVSMALNPDQVMTIGAGSNETPDHGFFFNDLIDDVRIYSYAKTADEVALLYHEITGKEVCTGYPEYDVTGPEGKPDCVVDLYEFAEFAQHWLECNIVPSSSCP